VKDFNMKNVWEAEQPGYLPGVNGFSGGETTKAAGLCVVLVYQERKRRLKRRIGMQ